MIILKYCTNCDQDAFSGLCGKCGTTNHIIERDSDEKCAACGEEWRQHGNGKSASACKIAPGGHFVPPTPTTMVLDSVAVIRAPQGGMKCAKCGDFNDYATANQGSQFICYTCRQH